MPNPIPFNINALQQIGLITGQLGPAADHQFIVLAGKGSQLSSSTHGPERRKQDRPVCDCDDD